MVAGKGGQWGLVQLGGLRGLASEDGQIGRGGRRGTELPGEGGVWMEYGKQYVESPDVQVPGGLEEQVEGCGFD